MKKCLLILLCAALLLSLPVCAAEPEIVASPQSLRIDGAAVACEKYNIDGRNYFKLRDLALLLTDTCARFAVDYDETRRAVIVTTGLPYAPDGSELTVGPDQSASGVPSAQRVWIDGVERTDLTVWNFGGHNFFQLRELGQALGFGVDYDPAENAALVESGGSVEAVGAAYLALRQWVRRSYNDFDAATGDPVYWREVPFGGVWRRCGLACGDDGGLRVQYHAFTSARGEYYVSLALTPGGTVHRATIQYYSTPSLSAVPFYGEADVDAAVFTGGYAIDFDVVRGWPEDTGEKANMARLLRRGLLEALDLAQTLLTEEAAPGLELGIGGFGFDPGILPKKSSSPRLTSDLARPLRLYSHDGSVSLGVVALDDRNGIWNTNSPFGNPESDRSIMNEHGRYGSETSDESPFNPYATSPPLLRDANGGFLCYVSMNEGYAGAYTLREICAFLIELGD